MGGFSICSKCNAILQSSYCKYCKENTEKKDFLVSEIVDSSKKEDSTTDPVSEWVGPLNQKCDKCNQIDCVYFMIKPPHTADQPVLVIHKCFKCNIKSSQYRH